MSIDKLINYKERIKILLRPNKDLFDQKVHLNWNINSGYILIQAKEYLFYIFLQHFYYFYEE